MSENEYDDNDNDDDDDECFYDMTELLPAIIQTPEINEDKTVLSEPTTPTDENFYQIDENRPEEIIQAHIDEPLTPGDELKPNFHYTILTSKEYFDLMMNYVDEVKDILELSSSIVKLLLNYFKWDKQRLLEKFYEIDHDQFFQQAKIINPFSLKSSNHDNNQLDNSCLICCSDNPNDMFNLECKHIFCNTCWKNYIINEITHEGHSQTINCPDLQCDILVDDETILKFLDNNEFVKHLYTKLILNSYVDNNPRARWCPGKNCGHIINATSLTSAYNYAQLITCHHCQTSFCFQCAQPWHDPIKCILLLQWNKTLVDDSQTIIWLKGNTKICPKCKVNIEKNGGCNHMTCRNCHHEFCWLCFGKWSSHTDCNRFNGNEDDNENVEAAQSISRYIHYYDRFRNHERSLDLEKKLFENISLKLKSNEEQLTKYNKQMIEKAFEILFHCRQMLIYTYPFAYYLVKNNQSIVFEQNQADLERICEELSGLLEKDFTKEGIFEQIKKQLYEKSQYCHGRKNVLLEHVKEGYTNDYWQYQDSITNVIKNKL